MQLRQRRNKGFGMRYLWLVALGVVGCNSGVGTVQIGAWGEDAAVDGYAAEDLADGWAIHFDHWVTAITNLRLVDPADGAVMFEDTTSYVADWSLARDPVALVSGDLPEGRYDFGFDFAPASADATNVNAVPTEASAAMVSNGWNTWVQGSATKGAETVTFAWGMANARRYGPCTNGADETQGVAVSAGEIAEATLFVHTDHLLWDRLGTEEAMLRFAPIAAWADETGAVDLDALAGSSTASLTGRDGLPLLDDQGDPLSYDDAGLGLSNLRDFIVYSTAQQGHLNGGGECPTADR